MNEYMAIDSGGYFLTNSICIFITAWPDASQRSRDGVWLNRSTMGAMCKTLYEQCPGLVTGRYDNLSLLFTSADSLMCFASVVALINIANRQRR